MEIGVLVAFLSPFMPYLQELGKKLGEKAAESVAAKVGTDGWEQSKQIWNKLLPQLPEEAKVVAEQVAAKPESSARQAMLQEELEALLQGNPQLAKEIAEIMATVPAPNQVKITQVVTGDGNQTVGLADRGSNVINTGNFGEPRGKNV
jgi:hypothetical protein